MLARRRGGEVGKERRLLHEAESPRPAAGARFAAMRDDLREATGQTAEIRRTSPPHYLLVLTSERVELTITWRRNHSG